MNQSEKQHPSCAAGVPVQMDLPAIPLPLFAPRWPNTGTDDYTALELFVAGEFVTVERFRQLTDSTRLPATVSRLKRMGWPIERYMVPEPSRRNRSRRAGVWHLPKKYIEQVQVSPVQAVEGNA